ncbi:MAG: GAF domain-containing protein [Elusimicrobiaceae bacterium]|nr:GAF domain-containing protein [Elusimicrobiaceae bacterium]
MEKKDIYKELSAQARALLHPRFGWLSNAANLSALIYHNLPDLNWAGFYLLDADVLRLGPFQGKPACTEIALGKGVCGTAALEKKTLVVPDVHQFAGHIACDSASKSEIVIPVIIGGKVWGVLDIDSPVLARFDEVDRAGLEELVRIFTESSFKKCP